MVSGNCHAHHLTQSEITKLVFEKYHTTDKKIYKYNPS